MMIYNKQKNKSEITQSRLKRTKANQSEPQKIKKVNSDPVLEALSQSHRISTRVWANECLIIRYKILIYMLS